MKKENHIPLKKNYKLTKGINYGLDFLIYTDDISKVHAKYGVLTGKVNFRLLIVMIRLMRNVNKRLLVFNDGKFWEVRRV